MCKIFSLIVFVVLWKFSAGLSPVIIIPGLIGNQLDERHNKTEVVHPLCKKVRKYYIPLWLNLVELSYPAVDCFVDNARLVYDNDTRTTRSPPGVKIRVPGWGRTETVEWLDPMRVIYLEAYFDGIVDALVNIGYERDTSIRAAPYDFRQAANEHNGFFERLKDLVEETYTMNGNSSITLLTHSMGGRMTQHFLMLQTQEWKDQYIKRLIALSTPWGGAIKALRAVVTGIDAGYWTLKWEDIRTLARTWPSVAWMLPSTLFWEPTEVLVQTAEFKYTINDLQKLFLDMKVPDTWEMRKDTEVLDGNFTAPGVEVHCVYGTGVPTVERLVYKPGESLDDDQPVFMYGDGDGTVNIRSLKGCAHWRTRSGNSTLDNGHPITIVTFDKTDHLDIMHDKRMLDYVTRVLSSG